MAKLTDYQVQAKRRIKKALHQRTVADRKARALGARLVAVLADAATAAAHVGTLNGLYGTAYVGQTALVAALAAAGVSAAVATAEAGSLGGFPEQLYAVVADANGGAALAADAALD